MYRRYYRLNGAGGVLDKRKLTHDNCVLRFSPSPGKNVFLVFDGHISAMSHIISQRGKYFHEVVVSGQPQKMVFDIDLEGRDYGDRLVDDLLHAIVRTYKEEFSITLTPEDDFMYLTSHAKNGSKFSCHIVILNYYLASSKEAKVVYREVLRRLDCPYVDLPINVVVDSAIYGKNHSLRTFMSVKHNEEDRPFIISKTTYDGKKFFPSFMDSLPDEAKVRVILVTSMLTNVSGCEGVLVEVREQSSESSNILDEELGKVAEMVDKYYGQGVYIDPKLSNGRIFFSRGEGRWCDICHHTHENMGLVVILDRAYGYVGYCGRTVAHIGSMVTTILDQPEWVTCVDWDEVVDEEVSVNEPPKPTPTIAKKVELVASHIRRPRWSPRYNTPGRARMNNRVRLLTS